MSARWRWQSPPPQSPGPRWSGITVRVGRSRHRRTSEHFACRSCSPCRRSRCRQGKCRWVCGNGRWCHTTGRIGWASRSRRGRSRRRCDSRCRQGRCWAGSCPRIRGSRTGRQTDSPCRACTRRRSKKDAIGSQARYNGRSYAPGNPSPAHTCHQGRRRTIRRRSGRRR